MSLRISADDALKRGLIDERTAKQIKAGSKERRSPRGSHRPPMQAIHEGEASDINGEDSPQRILFEALCKRLPGRPQWEVKDLIQGRHFRADIFIPPYVVVEVDGFRFHRSLDAFKKDRKRQNLLAANGYIVFRTFAKEVFDDEERQALVEMIAKAVETGLQFREAR